jgi:hypothetical protein
VQIQSECDAFAVRGNQKSHNHVRGEQ